MVTYTLTATRLLGYQVKRLHHWRQQLFVIITINANTKLKITEYQIINPGSLRIINIEDHLPKTRLLMNSSREVVKKAKSEE